MSEHSQLWISIFTAIIGLAIVAVILSRSATTVGVLNAAFSGFGGILGVAVSPVTGSGAAQTAAASVSKGSTAGTPGTPGSTPTSFTQNLDPIITAVAPLIGATGRL